MRTFQKVILGSSPVVLLVASVAAVAAQETPGLPAGAMAQQSLRPYWHVFIAYAIVIVVVMVWAGSIAKRLSHVEDRLAE